MRTAFVTGPTGLLGNALVKGLVHRGIRVRALARSTAKAETQFSGFDSRKIEVVVGDLSAPADLERSLEGTDVPFHWSRGCRKTKSAPTPGAMSQNRHFPVSFYRRSSGGGPAH